jgi:LPXTG-site transpeptidase (sortase) family protein
MSIPEPRSKTLFLIIMSVVAGITVYAGTGIVFGVAPAKPVPSSPSATPVQRLRPPTAVNIPKIGKNLPVKPATVNGNTWDLFPDAVAWLTTSAVPGAGNVILYAHDWKNLWGDLSLLVPGDKIEVEQNGVWKQYAVRQSRAVQAGDVQAVLSDKNQLTLFTCEGTFDQKRRVVYAVPVD